MTDTSNAVTSGNKFKIGLFAANCSGGIACTTVPERWQPTWENNVTLARMADEAGLEFMLPLGRWAGYGGETDHNGTSFETIIWAAGILGATKRIIAFSTLHVGLINPIFAAKQIVTAEHIGGGRFGLNIVCGWNADEFGMFGIELGEHDRRYEQGEEWLEICTRVWTETEPFDYDGEFFHLKNVRAEPKPISTPRPLIMNAGGSAAGLDFAVKNADFLFRNISTMENAKADIAKVAAGAKALDRNVGIFTNAYVVCRPTTKEAEEYHHYYAVENADEDAVDRIFTGRGIKDNPDLSDDVKAQMKIRIAAGNSAFPLVGDPDTVVQKMTALSEMGLAGIAMGLVHYVEHFPYFRDEILPRLVRAGLREEVPND
ncbi:MAG: LLM class flavin-dependent oxidoreductase [Rhodospirillales bacterium]|nr:LLM class flavin-dependent oxidoreductase [Rhodospirillales bacterium]